MPEAKTNNDLSCLVEDGIEVPTVRENRFFQNSKDQPFKTEFKWEGKVDRVEENKVYATMYSIEDQEWDEFSFSINDVETDDKKLVKEGALFNFYIGYSIINGTRKRDKLFKFRRIYLGSKVDQILDTMNDNNILGLFSSDNIV